MTRYILKRTIICIAVFFLVMFVVYSVMYMLPESYAETAAREFCLKPGNTRSAEEWKIALEKECGLDKGLVEGYFSWIRNFFYGDFGISWYYGVTVTEKFYSVIGNSMLIGSLTVLGEIALAISLGVLSAEKRNKITGRVISVLSVIFVSVPVFFIAALMKYIFSVKLGWFEFGGLKSNDYFLMNEIELAIDRIWHTALPVVTGIIAGSGALIRYTSVNVSSVLDSRYIKYAKAKGLSQKDAVKSHALRNAAVPVINMLCRTLPCIVAGTMVVETLFSINGIGYASYTAIVNGDIPFTMFYMMHIAGITVLGAFAADIFCACIDYRIRNIFAKEE